jgi:AcrR family transcriptional regulator
MRPMVSRERIIAAAAYVYAHHGFRGATTRRIAEAAGVNEITLFRQFGSKEALINEALSQMSADPHALPKLPDAPVDPETELTAWCEVHLNFLRANRSLIRKTMGEIEERPEAGDCSVRPNRSAAADLKQYMRRLYEGGFIAASACSDAEEDSLAHAAGAMLMAALFGDAMGRDLMPDMYPQPASGAATLYVRLFLRALGVAAAPVRALAADAGRKPTPAGRPRRTSAAQPKLHPTTPKTRQ